jgi:hypothetical protein
MLLTDNPTKMSAVGQSGAQARAIQTLREGDGGSVSAKRLDCVRFTAALARHFFHFMTLLPAK